jgi:hypothetical protein
MIRTMRDMLTRYMVLGGPVPAALQAELAGLMELVAEGAVDDADVDGVIIYARPESLPAFRRFRRAGGSLPIFALADGTVEMNERLQWIRHGADDLLDPRSAADNLRRKLKQRPAGQPPATEADRGMFLDRYLRCMMRYVAARQALIGRLGEHSLSRYLDCVFLRDQALRAAEDAPADAFGQRRGGQREMLRWPLRMVDPLEANGEILNVGADGCALSLPVQPPEKIRIEVATGALTALLDVEVRWQRRVARDRWEMGGLVVGVTFG